MKMMRKIGGISFEIDADADDYERHYVDGESVSRDLYHDMLTTAAQCALLSTVTVIADRLESIEDSARTIARKK